MESSNCLGLVANSIRLIIIIIIPVFISLSSGMSSLVYNYTRVVLQLESLLAVVNFG